MAKGLSHKCEVLSLFPQQQQCKKPDRVVHACCPNFEETETGGLLDLADQAT